jgi:DNA-3-methyladenine glycosylase
VIRQDVLMRAMPDSEPIGSDGAIGSGPVPVERAWLTRPALELAPDILGALLVSSSPEGAVAVRITEVEAYEGADDPGSHAFRGRTRRNEVMFGRAGHLYVYFTYGMHWCANVVCGPAGKASAVLLRAGEVIRGLAVARSRRPSARTDNELARGPARLASTLALGPAHNGLDLCDPDSGLVLRPAGSPPGRISTGPRVGLARAADRPWRYWITGDPTVSTYRPHTPRRRGGL